MKISLYGKHWGLVSHLRDLLEGDHEVSVVDANTFPAQFNLREQKFAPDVHISTFPYDDIKFYNKTIPLILYATDPVYPHVIKEVKEIQKWQGCLAVAAEACYPPDHWPINPDRSIPFAINPAKYIPWIGGKNRVAVVNRKARERWVEVVRGATGIVFTLEEFLAGLPFDILNIEDNGQYRHALSQYDVMFYFSSSPYTLVMFEGMGIGMPMVGFNHHHHSIYKPIEKYLNHYSTNMEEVRNMLKTKLLEPKKEVYPVLDFATIKSKWNLAISDVYATFKRL